MDLKDYRGHGKGSNSHHEIIKQSFAAIELNALLWDSYQAIKASNDPALEGIKQRLSAHFVETPMIAIPERKK